MACPYTEVLYTIRVGAALVAALGQPHELPFHLSGGPQQGDESYARFRRSTFCFQTWTRDERTCARKERKDGEATAKYPRRIFEYCAQGKTCGHSVSVKWCQTYRTHPQF